MFVVFPTKRVEELDFYCGRYIDDIIYLTCTNICNILCGVHEFRKICVIDEMFAFLGKIMY